MNKTLIGDCRETLKQIPDGSVQCCVTSPPYWGLRRYLPRGHPDAHSEIGQERTPAEYVETMVGVFRELRRCLHDSATVFLNVGDSYFGGGRGGNPSESKYRKQATNVGSLIERTDVPPGMKDKDLCLIPWRLAIALQDDGWYVRSVICWAKKSCMPESVQGSKYVRHQIEEGQDDSSVLVDCPGCTKCEKHEGYILSMNAGRPTNSWEPIFLLAKSASYFYDAFAVREKGVYEAGTLAAKGGAQRLDGEGVNARPAEYAEYSGYRNQRNVWHLGPEQFSAKSLGIDDEDHFAVFPSEIPKRAIMAGTSEKGCCPTCFAPWVRVVEKGDANIEHQITCGGDVNGEYFGKSTKNHDAAGVQDASAVKARVLAGMVSKNTVGWKSVCAHNEQPIPCTVLDPFLGSGTTAQVAQDLGRSWIGCELNDGYVGMQKRRTAQQGLFL